MAAELEAATRLGAYLHVHFSTSSEEDDWCREHTGTSGPEQLVAMGMLEVPTILAHCNTVPVDELPLLAGRRARRSPSSRRSRCSRVFPRHPSVPRSMRA